MNRGQETPVRFLLPARPLAVFYSGPFLFFAAEIFL
jgi:hypothetical protein